MPCRASLFLKFLKGDIMATSGIDFTGYSDNDFIESLKYIKKSTGSRMKRLNTWYVIDPATNQRSMKIDENRFVYKENRIDSKTGETFEYESEMDFLDYTEEDIEDAIAPYYESLDFVKRILPHDWKQIVLECIFEQEQSDREITYP
jgi:hypothetical protein